MLSMQAFIQAGEAEVLAKITTCDLHDQVNLMCTVPGVTKMLAMRIVAEMGANYDQRYRFCRSIRVSKLSPILL